MSKSSIDVAAAADTSRCGGRCRWMLSNRRIPRLVAAGALLTGLTGAGIAATLAPASATPLPALGLVSTVAGGGAGTTAPTDGMQASDASFNPLNVAVDAVGNLVVLDTGHYQIDVVARSTGTDFGRTMTSGKLYIIAGTGGFTAPTNGVLATTSAFDTRYMRTDPSGNVLIGDGNGYLAVVAETTGTFYNVSMTVGHVYLVAGNGGGGGTLTSGGVATSEPIGVQDQAAVDANGNLVLADEGNYLIEVVAESTGTYYGQSMTSGHLYFVAGTAGSNTAVPTNGTSALSAQFGNPNGVSVDPAGNLVVNDSGFNLVEVVAENTGTYYGQSMTKGDIYIIAGKHGDYTAPTSGSSATNTGIGPLSAHVDVDGNVIIADNTYDVAEVVPGATGTYYGQSMTAGDIYFIAGVTGTNADGIADDGLAATAANLDSVSDTTFDSAGNLYIGSSTGTTDGVVREFGPAPATITTTTLTGGTQGTAYNTTLAGTGSTGPLNWQVTTGSLPAGLSLNASTGAITGIPTASGTVNFTVTGENGYYNNGAYGYSATNPGPAPWANEAATQSLSLTVAAVAGLPTAPTVTVTPGDTQLTLSWPQNPAGENITSYSYSLDGGSTWITASPTLSGSTESQTITGLVNGTAYSVRVKATNANGSTPSAVVSGTPTGTVTTTTTVPSTTVPSTTVPSTTVPSTTVPAGTTTVPTTTVPTTTVPTTLPVAPPTSPSAPAPVTPLPPSIPSTALVPTGGGAAATPEGAGYWALSATGALSNHGNAGNFGSENSVPLNAPVVAVNSTTTGNGYWLAASDGGVFAFGDAPFVGSMGGQHLNAPVVAISSTPDNAGYRLAASDGGVFTFGTATFQGSMGGTHLNQAVTSMVSTPSGNGYWLVGADGGVFSFGDAQFFGSLGATNLNKHIVGIAATPDGLGYWLVAADGGVFTFGDAKFYGSLGATGTTPIVGIVANGNVGYRLITPSGAAIGFGTVPT